MDITFREWLDKALENIFPDNVVAVAFNIYEDRIGEKWSVEIVGTSRFDMDDDDWGCDEVTSFGTREDPLSWEEKTDWETVLGEVSDSAAEYLEHGKYSGKLKELQGVGVGFVEGDLKILYSNK